MKKIAITAMTLLLCFFTIGCEEESMTTKVCGVDRPATDLAWLSDIITQAEEDVSGNYRGNVWIKTYEGEDYIVTDMALGSGGLKFHCFDCEGTFTPIGDLAFYSTLSERELVFSNVE